MEWQRSSLRAIGKDSQGKISEPAQQTRPRILPQVIGHNALAFTSWRKREMRAGGDPLLPGPNSLGQLACPGSRADPCQSMTTSAMDYTSNAPAVANQVA